MTRARGRLSEAWRVRLLHWARRHYVDRRPPDRKIRGVYLWRWYIFPWGRWSDALRDRRGFRWLYRALRLLPNVCVHLFRESDDARAPHDHPWASMTILLEGRYQEVLPIYPDMHLGAQYVVLRWPGTIVTRRALDSHRIRLVDDQAISLFITAPQVRRWGFWCPQGWRPYNEFDERGCD